MSDPVKWCCEVQKKDIYGLLCQNKCNHPVSSPLPPISYHESVLENDSLHAYCDTGIPSKSHIIKCLPSTVIQLSSLHYPRQHSWKHRAIRSKNMAVTATDNARGGSCLLEPNPGILVSKQDVRRTWYFIPYFICQWIVNLSFTVLYINPYSAVITRTVPSSKTTSQPRTITLYASTCWHTRRTSPEPNVKKP